MTPPEEPAGRSESERQGSWQRQRPVLGPGGGEARGSATLLPITGQQHRTHLSREKPPAPPPGWQIPASWRRTDAPALPLTTPAGHARPSPCTTPSSGPQGHVLPEPPRSVASRTPAHRCTKGLGAISAQGGGRRRRWPRGRNEGEHSERNSPGQGDPRLPPDRARGPQANSRSRRGRTGRSLCHRT